MTLPSRPINAKVELPPAEPKSTRHAVTVDPVHGYRRLDPLPSASELGRFYESEYYDLLRGGGRAPDLRRLLAGGAEAERERAWLRETLYADITAELRAHGGGGGRVLDIGCGRGDLLEWLADEGFEAHGIEPSDEAAALARERGLDARTATVADLTEGPGPLPAYDAVTLLNVLEHVPEPAALLGQVRRLLAPGALVYIRVPNDFNPLQLAAQEKLDADPWWIAVPDHVNYFDLESLAGLCRSVGLDPVDVQADFPMELFLLMGIDYVSDPARGAACHAYRVEAERALPTEVRRALFRAFAAAGVGRNARLLARDSGQRGAAPGARGLPAERDGYRFVALRQADIAPLREFRNAQIDVLRQAEPISPEQQRRWFEQTVVPEQSAARPRQLLVSMLAGEERFIGYGGLTNIDWEARRAEVSFLVDPARAADPDLYARDMAAFLGFLAGWAFGELGLNRLHAETYTFREHHISLLEQAGFTREGRLREHVAAADGPGDSLVHGLLAADRRAGA